MSDPGDVLDGYVPPSGWHAWAERRRAEKTGPQFGLEAMVRAFRHPGALIIRRVSQERSVVAWRPNNPLLQTVLSKGGRPKARLGAGVYIPVAGCYVVGWGDVLTIQTQRSHHIVIEDAVAELWVEGDPWAQDATSS